MTQSIVTVKNTQVVVAERGIVKVVTVGTQGPPGTPGVTEFIQLNDVPGSYNGQAGKTVRVREDEEGLDFSDSAAVSTFKTAGAVLSSLRVVRIGLDDGLAYYASNANAAHANAVMGITITAATQGDPVNILTSGPYTDSGWSWSLVGNQGLYLGANGVIVQGAPGGAAFTQQVGFVTGTNSAFIRIQQPIIN